MNGIAQVCRSRRTPVAVVLALLAALLSVGPATGVAATQDPTDPVACTTDGTVTDMVDGSNYAMTVIPPGVSVTAYASGTFQAKATPGGGYYKLFAGTRDPATDAVQFGSPQFVPDSPPTTTFTNVQVGYWWPSSTSRDVELELRAVPLDPSVESGIHWSLRFEYSDGSSGGACPVTDPSELYGPNPALGEQCPACTGGTAYSVNSLTGNEHFVLPGLSMKTLGPGIKFGLAYNSLAAATDGPVGRGWNESFAMSLKPGRYSTKVVTQETGATVGFAPSDDGTKWSAPARFNATLVKNSNGTWTFTRARRQIFTFDSSGRLTAIADRNGYTTSLTYSAGALSSVADTAGHQVNVSWSGGRISTLTDISDAANLRTISFGYDSAGHLTSYTDIGGGVWTLGYDSSHRLISVRSPRYVTGTAARQFHYDSQGRVDWEQDPLGQRTTLSYGSPVAGATTIVDPAGRARVDYYNSARQRTKVIYGFGTAQATSTSFVYNGSGMLADRTDGKGQHWVSGFGDSANPFSPTQTTTPLGRVRRMTYNASGDLTKLTDANGVVTVYTYDANGNPKTTTVASGSNTPAVVTYNYDDASHPGMLTSVVDPRGKTWSRGYNAQGDLTSVTDPVGRTTKWTYYPQGWPKTKVAAAGNVSGGVPADYTTTYTYNRYGRPLEVVDPLGHSTKLTYDADGHVTTITNGANDVTTKTWNAAGKITSVTTGSGTPSARTLTYTYGPDNKVATHGYDPSTTYMESWNAVGLLASTSDPDGHQTAYTYDANGNLMSRTTGAGTSVARTTGFNYDADNNRNIITRGSGTSASGTTVIAYNVPASTSPCSTANNTVYCTLISDPMGRDTTYFYDALGALVQIDRPGGRTYTYAHDSAGLRTKVTDPAGNSTNYTYDASGALLTKVAGGVNWLYGYNDNGLISSIYKSGVLTASYGYNRADQPTSVSGVGYGRDAAGRVSSITYPDNRQVAYTYNPAGDIKELSDGAGNTLGFGYSADGTLTSKTLPGGNKITTELNGAGLPTSISLANSGGNQLSSINYIYNASNEVTSEVAANASSSTSSAYTYDGQGRLASSTSGPTGAPNLPTVNYGYDAAGNMTTYGGANQVFNAAGQLTSSTNGGQTTTYDYNANGDRTKAIPSNGLGSTYNYDTNDRMVSATVPPPPSTPESDFHPLTASAILDTRAATRTGTCVGTCATLAAGGTLTFQVTGKAGIPSNATAVILEVTVPATAAGSLVLYPTGSSTTGRNITTASGAAQTQPVITSVSATGQVTVKSSVAADVIVGVTGYYAATANQAGALFDSIATTRVVDTRTGLGNCTPSPCGTLAAGGTTTIQVTGQAGIPTVGVVGVAYTLTAITPSATGSAIAYPADQSLPATTTLSYNTGITSSALAVTPLSSSGKFKLYSSKGSDYTVDVVGFYTQAADGISSMYVPFDLNSGISPRVLDTGNAVGICQPAPCSKLISGTPKVISLAKNNAVPGNATSAVLSMTTYNTTATGYLSLAPGVAASATASTMNYQSGINKTATTITGVQNAWVTAQTHTGNSDLIFDVEGYYVAPTWTTTYTYAHDGLLASTKPTAGTATNYTYDRLGTNGIPQLLNDQTRDYIYAPDGSLLETTNDLSKSGIATLFNLPDRLNSIRGQGASGSSTGLTTNYTPYGTPSSPLTGAGGFAAGTTDPGAPTGFNYLLNRFYDPATGVFTTPDPLQDINGQPYAYSNDNPTNETDPTGLDPVIGGIIGGVVGAVGNLTYQVVNNLVHGCDAFNNISWGQVAFWGLQGAMIGAGLGMVGSSVETAAFAESAADLEMAGAGVAGEAGGGGTTTLFRAVGQAEADDIAAVGGYRNAPGFEGKYFFRTQQQAEQYGQMMNKSPAFGAPNYLTSGSVPTSRLASAEGMEAGSEGPGLFFRGDLSAFFNVVNHGLIR